MEKRIVYTRVDGGISVITPAKKFIERLMSDGGITEQEALKLLVFKDVPVILMEVGVIDRVPVSIGQLVKRGDADRFGIVHEDIPSHIIDVSLVPSDRTFRDAWETDNAESPEPIRVNILKARDIHMDRIRIDRDKRLTELDKRKYGTEYDTERQTLRDIPQNFNLIVATTPDELKALWPEGLQ